MTRKYSFEVNSNTRTSSSEKIVYEHAKLLPQYAGACAANLSAFAVGNILGWTSPASPQLMEGAYGFSVSESQNSWIGGLMAIGAAISCIPTGYFTDKIGRKMTMLALVPLFTLGWALTIWATCVEMIYAGRFISGMCGGAVCVASPVFAAEICQKEIRGAIGSYYQLLLAGGIMFVYVIGSFLHVFWISVVCAIVPLIFGVLFLFFPDTPVYYLTKGKPEEARNSLRFFRGPNYDLEPELCELAEGCNVQCKTDEPIWKEYTTKPAIRGITISIGMQLFQQLSGVNSIIFYTVQIFKDAGSTLNPNYATILVGCMEVTATYCVTFVVDRIGRVVLIGASEVVCAICTFLMGIYFYLKGHGYDVTYIGWLPLVSLCLFILVFSVGIGPLPWALMPELLPARIKGTASSIACVVNWVCCFIVTKFFSDMVNTFGSDVTFWIYTFISAVGAVFSFKCIPETKGKSFEQIQRELAGEPSEEESRI